MAPGMALLFLMYTVSYGGRSILAERAQGTLPRLLVSPTPSAQVLGGKVLASSSPALHRWYSDPGQFAFLRREMGRPARHGVLILAAVFGATGWGMLITALARTPAGRQHRLGHHAHLRHPGRKFHQPRTDAAFCAAFSKITPNAWGLDGFTTLAFGGTLAELTEPITALLIMGAVLFRGFGLACSQEESGTKIRHTTKC